MIRQFHPILRKTCLGLVYASAVLILVALIIDTAGLVSQASTPPVFPTVRPTMTPTPQLAQVAQSRPLPVLQNVVPDAEKRVAAFHPKTGRYISAWLPNSFDTDNRKSFEANADILDEVSPFWYTTDAYGNLLHGSDARDQALIELAHSKNVLVIPTVHNVLDVDPVPSLLRNPQRRERHIRNIVNEVVTYNYDGIDIDYEMMSANLRAEYSTFIVDLAEALHSQGKLLTIAVHAKTSDYGGLGGFQDWKVIGQAVDRLRIMTYDYHWRGGGPGPVAPLYWVSQVAAYAKTCVDPAKVVIGVPFYGYNWATNGDAVAQTWDAIDDLIQQYGLEVNLKESDVNGLVQENWITYSSRQGRRTVWFATSRGLEAKLGLVQEMDLAGIAIWRLGGEDPKNWEIIRAKLVEDPFESQRMLNQVLPEH